MDIAILPLITHRKQRGCDNATGRMHLGLCMKPKRKKSFWVCLRIATILVVALAFGLFNGVWLPFASRNVVAREKMPNGGWVELVQYYHRPAKEYRTEVVVKLPNSQPESHPESQRLEKLWPWNAHLLLEPHSQSVSVNISSWRGGDSTSNVYFHPFQKGEWSPP